MDIKRIYRGLIIGLLLPFCLVANLYGQTITGKVISELSEPLIGASIVIHDTNIGVVTDNNGNYSITIDSLHNTLWCSYIGFEDKFVKIETDTIINITLKQSPIEIKTITIYGPQIKIEKRFNSSQLIIKSRWSKKPDTIHVGMADSTFQRQEAERINKIKDSIYTFVVPQVIPKLNDSINFINYSAPWFFKAEKPFRKYIVDSLIYPQKALDYGIQGTVYAGFAINDNNKMSDITILRGIDPSLDNAVISALKRTPVEIQTMFGDGFHNIPKRRNQKYLVKLRFLLIKL